MKKISSEKSVNNNDFKLIFPFSLYRVNENLNDVNELLLSDIRLEYSLQNFA